MSSPSSTVTDSAPQRAVQNIDRQRRPRRHPGRRLRRRPAVSLRGPARHRARRRSRCSSCWRACGAASACSTSRCPRPSASSASWRSGTAGRWTASTSSSWCRRRRRSIRTASSRCSIPPRWSWARRPSLIFEQVERAQPARVVFDSLSELRLLAQNSLRYRRQILALKQFFAGRQLHRAAARRPHVSQTTTCSCIRIAHGVILLEQLALDYGAERRRLRVIKMRGIRFRGGYHDFTIEKGGLESSRAWSRPSTTTVRRRRRAERQRRARRLLGGGLERGTSALLIGAAGVGKSSLALTYAIAAADRGEHAVVLRLRRGAGHRRGPRHGRSAWSCRQHVDAGLIRVPADRSRRAVAGRVRRQRPRAASKRTAPGSSSSTASTAT